MKSTKKSKQAIKNGIFITQYVFCKGFILILVWLKWAIFGHICEVLLAFSGS